MLIQETKISIANFDRIFSHVYLGVAYVRMDADGSPRGITSM